VSKLLLSFNLALIGLYFITLSVRPAGLSFFNRCGVMRMVFNHPTCVCALRGVRNITLLAGHHSTLHFESRILKLKSTYFLSSDSSTDVFKKSRGPTSKVLGNDLRFSESVVLHELRPAWWPEGADTVVAAVAVLFHDR